MGGVSVLDGCERRVCVGIDKDGPAYCFECGVLADSVHHIVETRGGWAATRPGQPDEGLPVAPLGYPRPATRGKVA